MTSLHTFVHATLRGCRFGLFMLFLIPGALLAQEAAVKAAESGISGGDIFEFLVIAGYLGGVFVLLPWVIYTNTHEGLASQTELPGLVESDPGAEQRNEQAVKILEEIEQRLTSCQVDGEQLLTITKGSQARFVKRGLDYIRQRLMPIDEALEARVNEFADMYAERSKRIFTGSKWVIGCAVGIGAFLVYQVGFSTFILIHTLGVVFYILSSRTPLYVLEKRGSLFGGGSTMIGALVGGLFLGAGAKHYNVYSDGTRERDHSSEFTGGMVFFLLLAVLAMFLGFLAAALGVVNFLLNYMNNALIPTSHDAWYNKSFSVS